MEFLLALRRHTLEGVQASPAFQQARSDAFGPQLYIRYLVNIWHYAQHSSIVIGTAGSRCVTNHPALADYLLRHAREELGHEQWALEDLAALGFDKDRLLKTRPVSSCAAMIGFEYYTAYHANPVGLFGWLYILESMGEDLGHMVADIASKRLGNTDCVKFLRGHGDADALHTRDLTEQISRHVSEPDLSDIHHVAAVVADLFVRMFHEIPTMPLPDR